MKSVEISFLSLSHCKTYSESEKDIDRIDNLKKVRAHLRARGYIYPFNKISSSTRRTRRASRRIDNDAIQEAEQRTRASGSLAGSLPRCVSSCIVASANVVSRQRN